MAAARQSIDDEVTLAHRAQHGRRDRPASGATTLGVSVKRVVSLGVVCEFHGAASRSRAGRSTPDALGDPLVMRKILLDEPMRKFTVRGIATSIPPLL